MATSATRRRRSARPKRRRWPVLLSAEEWARLTARAAAHRVSRPDFVRSLISGHHPGAQPGTEAAAADAWWDSRSPNRRVAIWRNHTSGQHGDEPENLADLLSVLEDATEPQEDVA